MKKQYFIFLLLLTLVFSACKQRVYLTVTEPPIVHLDNDYKRGAFINRTYSSGDGKVVDILDKGLSLEGNLDDDGSKAAIQGAFDYLTTVNRFDYLEILDSMTVENGGIDIFPAPLSWFDVQAICDQNNVDFLMVLEVYDTDTKVNYSMGTTTKSTPLGNINVPVHNATMTTLIKTGWRIYDPAKKLILDEFRWNDQLTSHGSGINPVAAASTLLNRGQAVRQVSTNIGRYYAGRIEYQRFRVWRNYYTKGSPNLKIARRRSDVGNWDGAAELWQKDLDSPKRKVAGRSTYNMAIYHEINGDLEKALEMAQKSYSDYRIKEGLVFANILRDRIARRQIEENLQNQ